MHWNEEWGGRDYYRLGEARGGRGFGGQLSTGKMYQDVLSLALIGY
jgi:hypothetical protein